MMLEKNYSFRQYTALGSGFNIAMKDLEIRGAGDLLGGGQVGLSMILVLKLTKRFLMRQ